MTSAIRAQRDREAGFTLIELLVVVIIIGILAAIAIPAFLNQRERAWQAELTSAVRNASLDIESEATAAGGTYPSTTAGDQFATTFVTENVGPITATGPIVDVIYVAFTNDTVNTDPAVGGTGFGLCMEHALINVVSNVPTNSVTYLGGTAGNGLGDFTENPCPTP